MVSIYSRTLFLKEITVYIFGTKADGTLNGVYDFIESNLGVLWTRSTDIGTLYDPMPTIALVKLDYHDKSPLDIRGWHLTGSGTKGEPHSDPGTEIMMSRNKLNAKFAELGNIKYWEFQKSIGLEPVNLGHNIHSWLLQSPTYQGLSDAEKAKCWNTDLAGNPDFTRNVTQLNFWNPNVAVAIAESVNAFLVKNSDAGNFLFAGEDILTAYETLKPYMVSAHVKDLVYDENGFMACPDGRNLNGTAVGEGILPLREWIKKLKSDRYNGARMMFWYPK